MGLSLIHWRPYHLWRRTKKLSVNENIFTIWNFYWLLRKDLNLLLLILRYLFWLFLRLLFRFLFNNRFLILFDLHLLLNLLNFLSYWKLHFWHCKFLSKLHLRSSFLKHHIHSLLFQSFHSFSLMFLLSIKLLKLMCIVFFNDNVTCSLFIPMLFFTITIIITASWTTSNVFNFLWSHNFWLWFFKRKSFSPQNIFFKKLCWTPLSYIHYFFRIWMLSIKYCLKFWIWSFWLSYKIAIRINCFHNIKVEVFSRNFYYLPNNISIIFCFGFIISIHRNIIIINYHIWVITLVFIFRIRDIITSFVAFLKWWRIVLNCGWTTFYWLRSRFSYRYFISKMNLKNINFWLFQ